MDGISSGLISGTLEHIRRPLTRNIQRGHQVLVISDTSHDPRVWQVILTILADIGAEATLALFEKRPADYYDPPPAVCEAMLKSDVNILVSSTGMLHCAASLRSMEKGIPSICLDGGMSLEWLQSGAITDDMTMIALRKHYVAKHVFGADAKSCRVTSRYGSDLTYSVENKIWIPPKPGPEFDPYKIINFQKDENRPAGKLYYYLYPTGELNVAPVEGSAQGKLVIDLTMHHPDACREPDRTTVVDGRVTKIDGGVDAYILRDHLATYGDECYMFPASAIGVNAKAIVRGIQREDKNIMGTMHFGLGTNVDVGGSIMLVHMDGVVLEPTLYVDGVNASRTASRADRDGDDVTSVLNHRISGSGPPVVLLHPVGLDLTTWDEVAPTLAATHTVIAVDSPGFGHSPNLPRGAKVADYARAVVQLMDHLRLDRARLIGASLGGMIAQTIALDFPDRVSALVPSACPAGIDRSAAPVITKRGADAETSGMSAVVDDTLQRWFSAPFLASDRISYFREKLLQDDVAGWSAAWHAIAAFDIRDRLRNIRCQRFVSPQSTRLVPPCRSSHQTFPAPGWKSWKAHRT